VANAVQPSRTRYRIPTARCSKSHGRRSICRRVTAHSLPRRAMVINHYPTTERPGTRSMASVPWRRRRLRRNPMRRHERCCQTRCDAMPRDGDGCQQTRRRARRDANIMRSVTVLMPSMMRSLRGGDDFDAAAVDRAQHHEHAQPATNGRALAARVCRSLRPEDYV